MCPRLKVMSILAIVVTLAATAGCAAPGTAPISTPEQPAPAATPLSQPVTITFWEWYGGASSDFYEREAELFHERYPWITVEYETFVIEWWMEERGDSTRFGIFALVDPDIWIPKWLFRIVSRRVFPSMVTNLEKHLVRWREEAVEAPPGKRR